MITSFEVGSHHLEHHLEAASDREMPIGVSDFFAVATPACVEIGRLADELRREHPEMLRSEALAKIYGTHRELAERAKREQVFDD